MMNFTKTKESAEAAEEVLEDDKATERERLLAEALLHQADLIQAITSVSRGKPDFNFGNQPSVSARPEIDHFICDIHEHFPEQ